MKNLHQLTDELKNQIKHDFSFNYDSATINTSIDKFISRNMLTATFKPRYPQYYGTALRAASFAIKNLLQEQQIIFGYWYKQEFYTTHKRTMHKTTRDLEKLLPMQQWQTEARHAMVYNNLKNFF
jgi:hypothetical protein